MKKPAVFTEEDLTRMRRALMANREPGAYREGMWNVSRYNRDPAVVGSFPERVYLRDITLRTMEQLAGVTPSREQRADLLRAIAETGVPSMQLGAFRRGYTAQEISREVAIAREVNPDCQVLYGGCSTEADMQVAAESGLDAVKVWSTYLGEAAPSCAGAVYHRAWQGREWRDLRFPKKPEDQVARSVKFVEWGKKYGVEVLGSINLAANVDEHYVRAYFGGMHAAGCRDVTFADGSSGLGPEAFAHLVTIARQTAPDVKVSVHTHNMFGMGMACAVSAVRAGASIVEVAVNEYEEHAGNPDIAVAALAFEALYGVKTGIDLSRLWRLARLGEEITGYPVQWNHPITGPFVYNLSGGDEYTQERQVDPLIHSSVTQEAVGGVTEEGFGATTGPFTMWDILERLGVPVQSREHVEKVLEDCKREARMRDGKLTDQDIVAIATASRAQ